MKATVLLKYSEVKDKLRAIFGESSHSHTNSEPLKFEVKKEEVFETSDVLYQKAYQRSGKGKFHKKKNEATKNPPDESGNTTQCLICKSIYHWANKCPHRVSQSNKVSSTSENPTCQSNCENPTLVSEHFVMCQSQLNSSDGVSHLLSETWNSAILDCGATKTVAGNEWFNNFYNSLPECEKSKVKYEKSTSIFRFGDGERVASDRNVKIPTTIGKKSVTISVDLIDKDVPLLLSRESMKNAKMELNFVNDKAKIFGEEVKLKLTNSGHYIIPLTGPVNLMNKWESDDKYKFTLTLVDCPNIRKQAEKLHVQFAHASSEKLIKLLKSAGSPWSTNKNLMKEIERVIKDCQTCARFKRPPARPVVGLPMATAFNECVAMDLKFFHGKILLHMIDHASRFSSGCRITSKQPDVVVKGIFLNWIKFHGAPQKFLTDNGGELMNDAFVDLCDQFNIIVKTTAAESPWSNGLVERHNLVLSEMLEKVLDSEKCDFDMALSWCIQAKNSLLNINGFTPFQIGMGRNPKLPSVSTDCPTTFGEASCDVVLKNLQVMNAARRAYVETESSGKIKKALSARIRSSNGVKFCSGDIVYYKRKDQRSWKGPGSVIGQDGQQVIVKHGAYTVRVHPCWLLAKNDYGAYNFPRGNEGEDSSTHSNQPEFNRDNDDVPNIEDSSDAEGNLKSREIGGSPSNVPNVFDSKTNGGVNDVIDSSEKQVHAPKGVFSPLRTEVKTNQLKKGAQVCLKYPNSDEWTSATLIKRAGKAGGKYQNSWNITESFSGETKYVDFDRLEWKTRDEITNDTVSSSNTIQEECLVNEVVKNLCTDALEKAKQAELESWKENCVFEEFENYGQDSLSVRWVASSKTDEKGQIVCKARLCARGFEEETVVRKDSPTCSKESVRLLDCVIASKSWSLNSLDIKSAFLQGQEIDREVFIKPPPEAKTDKLWRLKKCVYGLSDAPRKWYMKLKNELLKLGLSVSLYDDGLFYCRRNNNLIGLLTCHVDDIEWGGTPQFRTSVIDKIKQIFQISKESTGAFKYVGINMSQNGDGTVQMDQLDYTNSLTEIQLNKDVIGDRDRALNPKEKTLLRKCIGQLNWLACISRPDIAFDVSLASSNVSVATVNDLVNINKLIRKVQRHSSHNILFSKLDLNSLCIKGFSDSSYNNLKDGGSQCGHILFLSDKNVILFPIEWKSNRMRRIVRSALAAESLAASDSMESIVFLQKILNEVLNVNNPAINYIDSNSL